MLKIIFYDTFQHNVPLEHYCLEHRISKVSTLIDQNSYGGSEKLRKYPGHPEGPVCVSVRFSLICGLDRGTPLSHAIITPPHLQCVFPFTFSFSFGSLTWPCMIISSPFAHSVTLHHCNEPAYGNDSMRQHPSMGKVVKKKLCQHSFDHDQKQIH